MMDQPEAGTTRVGGATPGSASRRDAGPRLGLIVAGGIVVAIALALLAGGGWGLWQDRIERDGGYVTIGTTDVRTDTYAIVAELKGDGPAWLYGSSILGEARVRATPLSERPLFMGIARTDDVSRYLDGVGHGTIEHLAMGELSTTSPGGAPSSPPAAAVEWVASTDGTGEQTLLWKQRDGDWSVVLMNSDASAGVEVRGELGAEFPPLPWVAGGLLIAGGVLALLGVWLILRGTGRPAPAGERPPGIGAG
jgi:hypothetical protein